MIGISKSYNLSIYKHKNKILQMQYSLQISNLKQLESYQSDIRRISHDINNHKIILYNLIKNKDYDGALNYLDSYGKGFSSKKYELLTNHKILNALLLSKRDICNANNINLNLEINIPKELCISDFDLCIVVGNLIDNSIEACNSIEEDKYINIKSKIVNENFTFIISNSFNGSIITKNSKFLTSKLDDLNHGLGLSNVKSTVSNYNGTLEITYDKTDFTVFIMIPLI